MAGHRQKQVPEGLKCKQCDKEKRLPERTDGLGLNCATVKDQSQRKARAIVEQQKKLAGG